MSCAQELLRFMQCFPAVCSLWAQHRWRLLCSTARFCHGKKSSSLVTLASLIRQCVSANPGLEMLSSDLCPCNTPKVVFDADSNADTVWTAPMPAEAVVRLS